MLAVTGAYLCPPGGRCRAPSARCRVPAGRHEFAVILVPACDPASSASSCLLLTRFNKTGVLWDVSLGQHHTSPLFPSLAAGCPPAVQWHTLRRYQGATGRVLWRSSAGYLMPPGSGAPHLASAIPYTPPGKGLLIVANQVCMPSAGLITLPSACRLRHKPADV